MKSQKHVVSVAELSKAFLSLFFLACFVSCTPEKGNVNLPFQSFFDFKEEVSRLEKENPIVKKTVVKNGKTETVAFPVNWKNELVLFSECDINKPQYKDSYKIENSEIENGKIVKYIAKEKNLAVQLMEITYQDTSAKEIFIRKEVDNIITKSHYELHYFPGEGYSISARQSVVLFYDEEFKIEGKFLSPKQGKWRLALKVGNEEIPFHFELKKAKGKFFAEIINAEEKIICEDITLKSDSIFIKLPVFDSEIKGKFISDTLINGAWFNYSKGSDYIVPLYAEYGKTYRFKNTADSAQGSVSRIVSISGKWEADFSPGTKDFYKAVGIFNQNGTDVTGTFLTETGDYRYLEGVMQNENLYLSCFDGSHAFLFKATLNKEQKLEGMFYSGTHWKEPWTAHRNEKAKLTNPDSLTFLKAGYAQLSFSFPDLDSNIVSLSDKKFKNRVVIIPITGSWCPNCLDETVFLSEIYKNYHDKGLEIVALSFERSAEFGKAKQAVKRFKEQLNVPYDFLIAGTASTKNANEALPMLNHIMSFPTTIFIDRKGKVRKIHTGFYGPGTGEYYTKFKEETATFVEKLLRE